MITVEKNQSVVTFNNVPSSYESSFICDALEQAAEAKINIDMISQSPATSDKISFGFTLSDEDVPKLMTIINANKSGVQTPMVNCGTLKFTVKSVEMVNNAGYASKVFSVLRNIDCQPLLITTGIDEISILVNENDAVDLEKELNKAFD